MLHPLKPFQRVALLAVVACGVSVAAAARDFVVAAEPALPTWNDPVTLTVSGTACAPAFAAPRVDAASHTVDVDLVDDCAAHPPGPFAARVGLGRLDAAEWIVTLHDASQGGSGLTPLLVYDVYDVDLMLPTVATDDQSLAVRLGSYQRCPGLWWNVEGNVVDILLVESCIFFFPPPTARYFDVPLGALPAGDYDVRVSEGHQIGFQGAVPKLKRKALRVWHAAGCLPSSAALCLQHGRFRVEASWRSFDGSSGSAHAAPLAGSDESGLLWFFAADNSELTVKLLDGCAANQRWWVFVSSSSTVQYDVVVTDTATGAQRTYHNDLGHVPSLVADTATLPCLGAAEASDEAIASFP